MDGLTKTSQGTGPLRHYGERGSPHAIGNGYEQWSPERRAAIIDAIPLKRLGQPQDVAACVRFLVSEGAGFITGEIIDVNGGFLMD